jgi:DNA-binding transcriptional regulator GbsR (MarR family)
MSDKVNTQVLEVIEGIGDFIEYWGFKKVHGKIWSLIFLTENPVDANYIMSQLGISKSLVSMSLKDLMAYNVVLEYSEKMSTQHYVSNPNLSSVIMQVLMGREAKMLMKIKNSCDLMNCLDKKALGPHISPARAKKLTKMVRTASAVLKTFFTLKQFSFKEVSHTLNINEKEYKNERR